MMTSDTVQAELRRDVGFAGAVLLGLGSIVGTGVFVSIGIATGVAGPAVIIAVCLAAAVASFNGLSSAQLAAVSPQLNLEFVSDRVILSSEGGHFDDTISTYIHRPGESRCREAVVGRQGSRL